MATYETLSVFREPCCLVENCSDGTLKTCSDVLNQIKKISSPLNVITITGPSRTGKSYLLNRLAEKKEGFLLGKTIHAVTNGIWVWCRRHPRNQNEVILLMDTEGLGDIEKGNEENDTWIFALSVLMSSTLAFNSLNILSQDGLSKLEYVTELTQRIKAKSTTSNEDGRDFHRIFPNFVWVLRDVYLDLEINGQPCTPDQYLSNSLKLKEGTGKRVDDYNRPRQCINNFFEDKKCFIFPIPPKESKKLKELEKLHDSELDPQFLCEEKRFCNYIYGETFPKTASGQPINGRMFCNLLEKYVSDIQKGDIPCEEDAVKNMAEIENANALKDAFIVYAAEMKERLNTIDSITKLFEAHLECSRMALERFMSMSTLDEHQKYQSELKKETLIAELAVEVNDLKELQSKCKEETENKIKELRRKIRQREDESKISIWKNMTQEQQLKKMILEVEQEERNLRDITEGGSSFAKFLHSSGSVLLKAGVGTVVLLGKATEGAVFGICRGAYMGGKLCTAIDETGLAKKTLTPLGILVGGALGGVVGLGMGIYEAVDWILDNIDK